MSILKLRANGQFSCKPDIMVLSFHFKVNEKIYEDVLNKGTSKVSNFIDYLISKGFSKDDYKTLGFSIKENYIEEKTNEKDSFGRIITKKTLDGYNYFQDLKLTTNLDLDLLRTLMVEISKMDNYPTLSLSFDIKDKELAKTEALKDAFEQCKKKAEMLAVIADRRIYDCVEINYDVDTNYNMGANYRCMNANVSLETLDNSIQSDIVDYNKLINPEDIIITDSIITIWELK